MYVPFLFITAVIQGSSFSWDRPSGSLMVKVNPFSLTWPQSSASDSLFQSLSLFSCNCNCLLVHSSSSKINYIFEKAVASLATYDFIGRATLFRCRASIVASLHFSQVHNWSSVLITNVAQVMRHTLVPSLGAAPLGLDSGKDQEHAQRRNDCRQAGHSSLW